MALRPISRTLGRMLLALAGLAAVLIAVPYGLYAWGDLPLDTGIGEVLTSPYQMPFLIIVITCVGWLAWIALVLSLVVEAASTLRGVATPHLPGLGGLQSLAGFLIGGLLLAAPAAASTGNTAAAVTVTAPHSPTGDDSASPSPQSSTPAPKESAGSSGYTTGAKATTLWDVAEDVLGDGSRWREIADLNPEFAQPDGDIPPRTHLTVPVGATTNAGVDGHTASADAAASADMSPAATAGPSRGAPSSPTEHAPAQTASGETASSEGDDARADAESAHASTYSVQTGDNLWDIAEDERGDGRQWPEIYDANKDTIDDPDLIYPGQELTLPPAEGGDKPQQRPQETPGEGTPDESSQPGGKGHSPAPESEQSPEATTDPDDQDSGHHEGAPGGAAPEASQPGEASPPSTHAPTGGQDEHRDRGAPRGDRQPAQPHADAAGESLMVPALAGVTVSGILAAAVLAAVRRHRKLQQRSRQPGGRIAMPRGEAARLEQTLHAVQEPGDTELLDRALRTLSAAAARTGDQLPQLQLVALGSRGIELVLAEPAEPIAPFTAVDAESRRWMFPATSMDEALLPLERARQTTAAPYPALTVIGTDTLRRWLLVDLEDIGLLQITGPARHQVARSLATELAMTELADHVAVSLVGPVAPGLAPQRPGRLAEHDHLTEALPALIAHQREQRQALADQSAASLRAARQSPDSPGSWIPHVLIDATDTADDDTGLEQLRTLVTDQPRIGAAVITTHSEATPPTDVGWVLHADPEAGPTQLPGLAVHCALEVTNDADYERLLELLATTDKDDEPAEPGSIPDLAAQAEARREVPRPAIPVRISEAAPDLTPVGQSTAASPTALPATSVFATYSALNDEPADTADTEQSAGHEPEPMSGNGDRQDRQLESVAGLLAADSPETPHVNDHVGDPGSGLNELEPAAGLAVGDGDPALSEDTSTPTAGQTRPAEVHALTVPAQANAPEEPEGVALPAGAGVLVRVLGEVDVQGADLKEVESNRLGRQTECAAWLVLHRRGGRHLLTEALYPTRRVKEKTVTELVSRVRAWFGDAPDGVPYVSVAHYSVSPAVMCDWELFQQHAAEGLKADGADGIPALRRALELVRGRPFAGTRPKRYGWNAGLLQEMVTAISATAQALAERCLDAGDPQQAAWAANKGLSAAEEAEGLWQELFHALCALGDRDGLEEAVARMEAAFEDLTEISDETLQLVDRLLKAA